MAKYIVADLHGRYDLYQEIEKFRKTDDHIICLGDCGDRGPQSIETIKAVADNPNWYYMMGNHEHLTCNALYFLMYNESSYYQKPVEDSINNGGYKTLIAMVKENPDKWYKFLRDLPYKDEVESESGMKLLLSHSGYDPATAKGIWDFIWSRGHFLLDYPTDKEFENTLMIHGHTPIPLVTENWKISDGAAWYGNTSQKINIDGGSVWTGATILLDADTLEDRVLYAEKEIITNDS